MASGGDPTSTKLALDTIVSRTPDGGYEVEGATTIDAEQAKALLDQCATVVDVRGIGNWRTGHLKGAIHSRSVFAEFSEDNLSKYVKKTEPVVFYCSGFT